MSLRRDYQQTIDRLSKQVDEYRQKYEKELTRSKPECATRLNYLGSVFVGQSGNFDTEGQLIDENKSLLDTLKHKNKEISHLAAQIQKKETDALKLREAFESNLK